MRNIIINGTTYNNVPAIHVPAAPIIVIPEASVSVNNSAGSFMYGIVSGLAQYDYPALSVTYDGVEYALPKDPDPNNYAAGYIGYGAPFASLDDIDFTTYPIRVEDDDSGGNWRLYNQNGGTHTIKAIYGGTAVFPDTSDTTATSSDVSDGKYFYDAMGVRTLGTGQGGVSSIPLAMRPDAEIIQTWSDDYLVVTDKGITIPAYSTSSKSLVASASLTPTYTLDRSAYDYFLIQRCLAYPIYNATTAVKGREEYFIGEYHYEYIWIPGSTMQAINGSGTYYSTSEGGWYAANTKYRMLYWSSTSALSVATASTYGVYQGFVSPSTSGATITIKSPSVTIRGSATYFSSDAWSMMTDVRCQYIIDLYRAPKNALGQHGFLEQSALLKGISCAQSSTHKLT